jgi:hypothetical protein
MLFGGEGEELGGSAPCLVGHVGPGFTSLYLSQCQNALSNCSPQGIPQKACIIQSRLVKFRKYYWLDNSEAKPPALTNGKRDIKTDTSALERRIGSLGSHALKTPPTQAFSRR